MGIEHGYQKVDRFLRNRVIQNKFPPGCVIWVGSRKTDYFTAVYGYRQVIPGKKIMHQETIFDLASLTKPICTALLTMMLYEEKELKLTDPIEKYLGIFRNRQNGKRTIKDLLTHRSGMPAWFPLYILPGKKRIEYLAKTSTRPRKTLYSCLGYITLGKVIEAITGSKLDTIYRSKVLKVLGLKHTGFKPGTRLLENIAATELGNGHEMKKTMSYVDPAKIKWRHRLIYGEAHDGNCFYAFKGVSGNAGLFSNAPDLAILLRSYLAGMIVRPDTVRMMVKNHTGGKEPKGLGWALDLYPGILSPESFGHTGFTGTMLVVDPKTDLMVIMLTNSVHPKVRLGIMPGIRKKVVQLIAETVNRGSGVG